MQGETVAAKSFLRLLIISIHSPYAGGDSTTFSTSRSRIIISINSPYAGGDVTVMLLSSLYLYLNPLPLCRGRLIVTLHVASPLQFQSTPPMQGETLMKLRITANSRISIHSPYAGGDR